MATLGLFLTILRLTGQLAVSPRWRCTWSNGRYYFVSWVFFGGLNDNSGNQHESNTPRTKVLAVPQVKLTPPALIVSSPDLSRVPQEYVDLQDVFSKSRADTLSPPHRPYDCANEFLPGTCPPRGRLFSLSAPERSAMGDYICKALENGFIRPSTSPAGAVFFFMGKKDGGLCPCIDYRGLNNITWKNRYPLPLMATAFELLQGTTIFTKLDLRNAYNLVRSGRGTNGRRRSTPLQGITSIRWCPSG